MAFLRGPQDSYGLYINQDRASILDDLCGIKQDPYNPYYNQQTFENNYNQLGYHYHIPPPIKIEPDIDIVNHDLSEVLGTQETLLNSNSSSSNNSIDVHVSPVTNSDANDVRATDDSAVTDDRKHSPAAVKQTPLKKDYKCSYCPRTLPTINLRKQHESLHTGAKLHKCEHCDMYFTTQYRKKVHEIRHGNDCPYTCSHCGAAFKSLYKRQVHERAHSSQRPYRCQYCGDRFATQYRKNTHEIGHISDTPYECRYCDEAFKTQYRCKQHELGHSSDKPYQCQFCHESFKSSHKRYIHVLSHSGLASPYQCPKCSATDKSTSFRTPYKLRAHLAAVHRLKPADMRELVQPTSQRDAVVLASTSATGNAVTVNNDTVRAPGHDSPDLDYLRKLPDDETVSCFSCNAMFGNKLHLIAHIRTTHTFTFL